MKNALMLTVALSVAACVPILYDYYYISLEGIEGVKVLETGRSMFSGFSHKPMPRRYEIARQSYVLEIELDRALAPNIWISATSESGVWLRIESVNASRCGGWRHVVVGEQVKNRYIWLTKLDPYCQPGNFGYTEKQAIVFNVIGDDGENLGREQLPIKIVRNGTVFDFDAI